MLPIGNRSFRLLPLTAVAIGITSLHGAYAQEPAATPSSAKPESQQDPAKPKPATKPQAKSNTESTLDTVVIVGETGTPLNYAGGRDSIDADTKATYPDASFDTLMRRTPGVYFLPENGNDSRISIGLRGNDPRRSALTTLLVDGIPISEGPYGNTDVDGLPITFERVSRIDVIRGGASVRYGPNSAGGIINLITEPIPDTPTARFTSRFGSHQEYSESTSIGGTWDRFGVLVNGVVKGGDGFRDNSDFRDNDGSLKLRYAINDHETISGYVSRFTELHAEQAGGLTQAAYEADPKQSLRPGSDFDFAMNRYVVQYGNRIDDDTRFDVKLWYQDGTRTLNDFRPIVGPFTLTRQQNSAFDSGALEASFNWRSTVFGLDSRFHHSVRYLTEMNDEFYVRAPIAGGPPNTPYELNAKFRGNAFSIFNEDVMTLAPGLEWGIGFRAESIGMSGESKSDGNQITKNYSLFLPETNLTWTFLPETAAYASFQKGFYPPQYETGFDPASVLYAPTNPERSSAYELGLRSREFAGVEFSTAIFETHFDNKIDFINTTNGKVPVNGGEARTQGIEASLAYDFAAASPSLSGLSVYGTITSQRSKIREGTNTGRDTPNSPHEIASWGTAYEHLTTGLWARIGGSYTASAFKDPANTVAGSTDGLNGQEPSYTLWDAAVGWNQRPDRTGVGVAFGVTNLFDEQYFRRFATGIYPGAERACFASVSYAITF